MSDFSHTHLVLIPSFNPGAKVFETVRAARAQWAPVWVVVDGSTDGTGAALQALAGAGSAPHGAHARAQLRQGRC
ncbi:glycosyl transferase family 2, partial [mine drainage metagenome]